MTQPRLLGWDSEDRKRIPELWDRFMGELENSTNVLCQMEAKALAKTDAISDERANAADAGWWRIVRAHREELIGTTVDLFYMGWGFAYSPETQAMEQEYRDKTVPALKTSLAFEKQKQYLAAFTPYDFLKFHAVFSDIKYSKEQAAELKPMLENYRSNVMVLGDVPSSDRFKKFVARNSADVFARFERLHVVSVLHPPPPPMAPAAAAVSPPAVKPHHSISGG